MRELPVEHADEAVLADDEVADAVVAVHDDRLARRRTVLAQPPEPELDRRMRLADLVELLDHPLELRLRQERDARRRDRVDLRELLRHLHRQRSACARELVLLHDPPPDRLALEPLHHERLAPGEIGDVAVRARRLHARLVRRLEHRELVLERERVPVDHAAGRAAHEQPLAARVDRPRLLRGAAGEQHGLGDLDLAAERRRESRLERLTHLCDHCCQMATVVIPDLIADRREQVRSFMEEHVYPNEQALRARGRRGRRARRRAAAGGEGRGPLGAAPAAGGGRHRAAASSSTRT